MEPGDALEVLGLEGPAAAAEVKRAYRELARRLHPDTGGDAERFRRIQRAYETIRGGTDARVDGPRAQVRVAAVDDRWWDAPGAWYEHHVATEGVDLDVRPSGGAQRADLSLLASLLRATDGRPVRPTTLHSRAPGSWLHRLVTMLQPDLLATLDARPAGDGPRAGHDVRVVLTASARKARRIAAEAVLPPGWTRRRGADTVTVARDLRPCPGADATAVRVAREIASFAAAIGWPLEEWFVLVRGADRPT